MLEEAFRSIINFGKGDGHLTRDDLINNFKVFEQSKVRCEEQSFTTSSETITSASMRCRTIVW
jgi:hypothetical protein